MSADRFIPEVKEVTFSGTTSGAIDMSGLQLVAIETPASVVGNSFTFTASVSATGTFDPIYDEGSQYSLAFGSNRWMKVKLDVFCGVPHLKLVSNGSEAAGTTFKLVCRPLS
jgi:hypothetical protein